MVQRSTCLCDGKIIGIESIFTVVNGMQINIPEKVEELRQKGRNNELFCPCGCGANLILVAGDKNIRRQHFRIRDAGREDKCRYLSEGAVSIGSKVVLKCWLEDKFSGADIESRVPVSSISDSGRKYEMSLLLRDRHIAVSYSHKRSNLSDEKFDSLEQNFSDVQIHYIVDIENAESSRQYPEMMMKVQKRQGYCLFLKPLIKENQIPEYLETELHVCFYQKNYVGYWDEIEVLSDKLSAFNFSPKGELLYRKVPVPFFSDRKKQEYLEKMQQMKINAEKAAAEQKRLAQAKKEFIRKYKEYTADYERRVREQKAAEENKATQKAEEKTEAESRAAKGIAVKKIEATIDLDQEEIFYDSFGTRWVRCEYCGKVATDTEFSIYGGTHHMNLGTCRECAEKPEKTILPKYRPLKEEKREEVKTLEDASAICPMCGGELVERNGRYGPFLGCSNYPKCKFTRNK